VTKKLVEEELPSPRLEEEEPEPLLYDADAAAKILGGISKAMVYRYVQHGELNPVKLGSRTLFTMEELQRFVRDRQKAG
jgi:excisionase family DNA binding protein